MTARDATDELTPTARGARIAMVLILHGNVTTRQIKALTGIRSNAGIIHLMNGVGLALPVYQPARGTWALLTDRVAEGEPRQFNG